MPRTVVYAFDAAHEADVVSGRKLRTIRPPGKRRHAAPGDALRLYVGMRTKACRLVAEGVCTDARQVTLRFGPGGEISGGTDGPAPIADPDGFARLDGFAGAAEMGAFFRGKHGPGPFRGVLIEWRLSREDRGPQQVL